MTYIGAFLPLPFITKMVDLADLHSIVVQSNYDKDDIKLVMNSKFLKYDEVSTLINVPKSKQFGLVLEADKTHVCYHTRHTISCNPS
jgi:hypothetical protein